MNWFNKKESIKQFEKVENLYLEFNSKFKRYYDWHEYRYHKFGLEDFEPILYEYELAMDFCSNNADMIYKIISFKKRLLESNKKVFNKYLIKNPRTLINDYIRLIKIEPNKKVNLWHLAREYNMIIEEIITYYAEINADDAKKIIEESIIFYNELLQTAPENNTLIKYLNNAKNINI